MRPFQNVSFGGMLLPPRLMRTTGNPGASVAGINTLGLANGALTYCAENQGCYQLDLDSVAVPDGSTVIAPAAGPGRWFLKIAGPIGPQGPQGTTGAQGVQGTTGAQGVQGPQGSPLQPNLGEPVDISGGDYVFVAAVKEVFIGVGGDVWMQLTNDAGNLYANLASGSTFVGDVVVVGGAAKGTTASAMVGLAEI